jgi:hypothetical protein
MDEYVVALVFSNFVLSKIYNVLVDYLNAEESEICASKIERYKDKKTGVFKDSNRTVLLLKKSLFDRAMKEGLNDKNPDFDFQILEYNLDFKKFPESGYSANFYIILPEMLKTDEAEKIIKEKMKNFVNFGLLEEKDYSLNIPLASRITGIHRGFAFLNFSDNLDDKIKSIIKLMLHHSYIFIPVTQTFHYLSVFWKKEYNSITDVPMTFKILKKQ